MKTTAIVAPNPNMQFGEITINSIKECAKNYEMLRYGLEEIRKNMFIYGFKGGLTDKPFTQHERFCATYIIDRVSEILDYCRDWKPCDKKQWKLVQHIDFVNAEKIKGSRFSSLELFYELVKITMFWKWEADGDIISTKDSAAALNLYESIFCLGHEVNEDHAEYQERNN